MADSPFAGLSQGKLPGWPGAVRLCLDPLLYQMPRILGGVAGKALSDRFDAEFPGASLQFQRHLGADALAQERARERSAIGKDARSQRGVAFAEDPVDDRGVAVR